MTAQIDAPQLRRLIGEALLFRQQTCRIVEVLDTPLALVLESRSPSIQGDSHGRARRQIRETHTIPVWLADGQLNPVLLQLEHLPSPVAQGI
jgi:hypothetical protein